MHILHVVGARPNFMKVAPVMAAVSVSAHIQQSLLHTGQHYDVEMSEVFFHQLGLPAPGINLEIGSGSQAKQTAEIMTRLETVLQNNRPDLVLVYGDVNSTVAATLVCAKMGIRVGHVEAGLRSFDRSMPEEINRLVTDQLSDVLFTHCADADENLRREGISSEKIHRVGNVMIDTLVRLLPAARESLIRRRFGLDDTQTPSSLDHISSPGPAHQSVCAKPYGLVTLHRPSNVDNPTSLRQLILALCEIAEAVPIVFPIHPRTRQRLIELHLPIPPPFLHLTKPLGYVDFLALEQNATFVITDSGGIQEETTYLGVPCLTMRENTERPITVTEGTNILVGRDPTRLHAPIQQILAGHPKTGRIPELWDGHASARISSVVRESLGPA